MNARHTPSCFNPNLSPVHSLCLRNITSVKDAAPPRQRSPASSPALLGNPQPETGTCSTAGGRKGDQKPAEFWTRETRPKSQLRRGEALAAAITNEQLKQATTRAKTDEHMSLASVVETLLRLGRRRPGYVLFWLAGGWSTPASAFPDH